MGVKLDGTGLQADRSTDRPTDRPPDRPTDRLADRQTEHHEATFRFRKKKVNIENSIPFPVTCTRDITFYLQVMLRFILRPFGFVPL